MLQSPLIKKRVQIHVNNCYKKKPARKKKNLTKNRKPKIVGNIFYILIPIVIGKNNYIKNKE